MRAPTLCFSGGIEQAPPHAHAHTAVNAEETWALWGSETMGRAHGLRVRRDTLVGARVESVVCSDIWYFDPGRSLAARHRL